MLWVQVAENPTQGCLNRYILTDMRIWDTQRCVLCWSAHTHSHFYVDEELGWAVCRLHFDLELGHATKTRFSPSPGSVLRGDWLLRGDRKLLRLLAPSQGPLQRTRSHRPRGSLQWSRLRSSLAPGAVVLGESTPCGALGALRGQSHRAHGGLAAGRSPFTEVRVCCRGPGRRSDGKRSAGGPGTKCHPLCL